MDWSKLEAVGYDVNRKTGNNYYQQYLKPSYYLEVYLRWTEEEVLLAFYKEVLQELEPLFQYHGSDKKSGVTKIRKRAAALDFFSDFLNSKRKYCWNYLSDKGGLGNAKEMGGIGAAAFKCWIHKTPFSEEKQAEQVQKHKEDLLTYETDMLPSGIRVSRTQVRFPIDFFESPADFLDWVLNTSLLKRGTFFSGTAGYKINHWGGYTNRAAEEQLKQILVDYPGLAWDIPMGNSIGRFLNEAKSDFLPVIKRINWLTFVSEEGLHKIGGLDLIQHQIEKNGKSKVHQLSKGIGIQACEKPALSASDDGFEQYVEIHRILNKLCYKSHSRDRYATPDDTIAKEWLYRFNEKLTR